MASRLIIRGSSLVLRLPWDIAKVINVCEYFLLLSETVLADEKVILEIYSKILDKPCSSLGKFCPYPIRAISKFSSLACCPHGLQTLS